MKGIGKGMREFNDAKQHVKDEIEAGMKEKDTTPPAPQIPSATAATTTPPASATP
jgi:sec-independent protein translocase protein TatA